MYLGFHLGEITINFALLKNFQILFKWIFFTNHVDIIIALKYNL